MRRAKHGQRENAAKIRAQELAFCTLRPRQHHCKTHPEKQRENSPEFSLHKIGDDPTRKPVRAG